MFFLNKNKILLNKINEYFNICNDNMETFNISLTHYLNRGNDDEFEILIEKIKKIENNADSVLHSIENTLYTKSLLPESREDIFQLFEKYDDIIDCSIHILRYLHTRNVSIPDFCVKDIKEMAKFSIQCYDQVRNAIEDLLGKRKNIIGYIRTINDYESICDDIQSRLIKKVFDNDIEKFNKIILSELIDLLSKLTDHCEDAADLINLINIKRVV